MSFQKFADNSYGVCTSPLRFLMLSQRGSQHSNVMGCWSATRVSFLYCRFAPCRSTGEPPHSQPPRLQEGLLRLAGPKLRPTDEPSRRSSCLSYNTNQLYGLYDSPETRPNFPRCAFMYTRVCWSVLETVLPKSAGNPRVSGGCPTQAFCTQAVV